MKAIEVSKPGNIHLVDVPRPELQQDDEVLVQVKACGICGSDVAIYHGSNPIVTYPRIIGHEVTGEVVAIGAHVTKVAIGDHVIVKQTESCGVCYACTHEQDNVCTNLLVRGVTIDGGYQQFYRVSEHSVYRFSPDLTYTTAVLIEPYTIAYQACSRGKLQSDDILLINGAGAVGAILVDVAASFGCKIIVTDIKQDKLEQAKSLGATYVLDARDSDLTQKIFDLTDGYGPTISIDSVCNPASFEFLVNITGNGGRVVTLGFDKRPSSISQFSITAKQLTIIGSRLQHNQFERVIDLFENHAVHPEMMVSHIFPFTDIKKAFEVVESGNYKKILLDFSA